MVNSSVSFILNGDSRIVNYVSVRLVISGGSVVKFLAECYRPTSLSANLECRLQSANVEVRHDLPR